MLVGRGCYMSVMPPHLLLWGSLSKRSGQHPFSVNHFVIQDPRKTCEKTHMSIVPMVRDISLHGPIATVGNMPMRPTHVGSSGGMIPHELYDIADDLNVRQYVNAINAVLLFHPHSPSQPSETCTVHISWKAGESGIGIHLAPSTRAR